MIRVGRLDTSAIEHDQVPATVGEMSDARPNALNRQRTIQRYEIPIAKETMTTATFQGTGFPPKLATSDHIIYRKPPIKRLDIVAFANLTLFQSDRNRPM